MEKETNTTACDDLIVCLQKLTENLMSDELARYLGLYPEKIHEMRKKKAENLKKNI